MYRYMRARKHGDPEQLCMYHSELGVCWLQLLVNPLWFWPLVHRQVACQQSLHCRVHVTGHEFGVRLGVPRHCGCSLRPLHKQRHSSHSGLHNPPRRPRRRTHLAATRPPEVRVARGRASERASSRERDPRPTPTGAARVRRRRLAVPSTFLALAWLRAPGRRRPRPRLGERVKLQRRS